MPFSPGEGVTLVSFEGVTLVLIDLRLLWSVLRGQFGIRKFKVISVSLPGGHFILDEGVGLVRFEGVTLVLVDFRFLCLVLRGHLVFLSLRLFRSLYLGVILFLVRGSLWLVLRGSLWYLCLRLFRSLYLEVILFLVRVTLVSFEGVTLVLIDLRLLWLVLRGSIRYS